MNIREMARRVVERLLAHRDEPPPRFRPGGGEDEQALEQEREMAARSAFTAYDHAENVDKRFHPRTWQAVKGSPYERMYRQRFNPPGE